MATITACLVVYNEEKVIETCLKSIAGFVDEIIVIHDGECKDATLEIARKYTDKVFVKGHVGMMEGHLVFAYKQATSDWLLRIDADEYLEAKDFATIKEKITNPKLGALICKWELWDGAKSIYFKGLEKMCFMRKSAYHYCGIPHEAGTTDLAVERADVTLRHRPAYNNVAWKSFLKKRAKWVPIHTEYFFPANISFECFNSSPSIWIKKTDNVKKHSLYYITIEPVKMLLGQLKNGLWMSWAGINVALQQYYYYLSLYFRIWKMKRQ